MNIQAINGQTFGQGKFRIPVKSMIVKNPVNGRIVKNVNLVKEYSNPKAEEIWNRAMKEDNFEKKIGLIESMGESRIIDISNEKRLAAFFENFKK